MFTLILRGFGRCVALVPLFHKTKCGVAATSHILLHLVFVFLSIHKCISPLDTTNEVILIIET